MQSPPFTSAAFDSNVLDSLAGKAVGGLFEENEAVSNVWAISPPAPESPPVPQQHTTAHSSCRAAAHPCAHLRRLTVARCRHLKILIDSHERKFKEKTGRLPKRSERGSMKPIYDEYRRLKQTVRGDAAMHIQCMFRGFRVRSKDTRSNGSSGGARGNATAALASRVVAHPNIDVASIPRDPTLLKQEKRALQSKLKKYEADFMKTHGRKVKYMADIEPVAADYKRYKELRAALNHVL